MHMNVETNQSSVFLTNPFASICLDRGLHRPEPLAHARITRFGPQATRFSARDISLGICERSVKGLIKKVGTSWYHHGVISHFWHLRSAIAFTILRQQLFCWYKSTSTRADTAAADVATQCLYINWSHRAERTCDPLLHYGGMAQFSNSHEICWNIRIGKI